MYLLYTVSPITAYCITMTLEILPKKNNLTITMARVGENSIYEKVPFSRSKIPKIHKFLEKFISLLLVLLTCDMRSKPIPPSPPLHSLINRASSIAIDDDIMGCYVHSSDIVHYS